MAAMEAAPELLFCGDQPGAQILLAYWQDPSAVAAGCFGGASLQSVERANMLGFMKSMNEARHRRGKQLTLHPACHGPDQGVTLAGAHRLRRGADAPIAGRGHKRFPGPRSGSQLIRSSSRQVKNATHQEPMDRSRLLGRRQLVLDATH
jgi:hypothetical protein